MKNILLILMLLVCSPAVADEYYIGQWHWYEDTDKDGNVIEEYWAAPQKDKVTGTIDLRTSDQASIAGGTPQGFALFAYSETVTDAKLTHLGSNLDEKPNAKARGAIQTKLGITPNKDSIRDIIYELLTEEADPTGQSKWKPLRPGTDRKNKIYFGSEGKIMEVAIIPFVSPEWENIQLAIQEDYKHLLRTEKHDLVAKWLDYQEDKYNVHYTHFLADGEIRLASLPHETTITESFNTADSDTLGPDLSWTETIGDLDISSNGVTQPNNDGFGRARAESDLSSDDHYAQIEVYALSGSSAEAVRINSRFSASVVTLYEYTREREGVTCFLRKTVEGTFTNLASGSQGAISDGTAIKIESDGSSIKTYDGASETFSVTDTSITGNLRTGFAIRDIGVSADNFQAADLAVAPSTRRIMTFF